jgi:hypothetical protein
MAAKAVHLDVVGVRKSRWPPEGRRSECVRGAGGSVLSAFKALVLV